MLIEDLPPRLLRVFLRCGITSGGDLGRLLFEEAAVAAEGPTPISARLDRSPSWILRRSASSAATLLTLEATERMDMISGDRRRLVRLAGRTSPSGELRPREVVSELDAVPVRDIACALGRAPGGGTGGATFPSASCNLRWWCCCDCLDERPSCSPSVPLPLPSNACPGSGNADEYGNALARLFCWFALVGEALGKCSYGTLDAAS